MTSTSGTSGSSHTDSSFSESGHSVEVCRGDLSRYISSSLPHMFVLSALLAGAVVPAPQAHAQSLPQAPVGQDLGPTVSILSPQYSDLLKGKAQVLIAVKTQRFAPEFVEMFVDDRPVTYDPINKTSKIRLEAVPSAAFDWVTTRFTDGPHNLKVRITDTQGFIGEADVTVYINNGTERDTAAPVLEWINIQSGQLLTGKVDVQMQAVDNFGVKYVIVSLNSTDTPDRKPPAWAWFFNRPPYTVMLDTLKIPDGTYVMKGTAYDVLENEGHSLPLYLGIANHTVNPTLIRNRLIAITGAPKAVDAQATTEAPTVVEPTVEEPRVVDAPNETPGGQANQANKGTELAMRLDPQETETTPRTFQSPLASMMSSSTRKGAAKIESALSAKVNLTPLRPERQMSASMPPRYVRLPQPIAIALGAPARPASPGLFTAPAAAANSSSRIANSSTGEVRATKPPLLARVQPQNRTSAHVAPGKTGSSSAAGSVKSGNTIAPVLSNNTVKPVVGRTPRVGNGTLLAIKPPAPPRHSAANTIDPMTTLQRRTSQGAITEASMAARPTEPARLVSLRLSSPSGAPLTHRDFRATAKGVKNVTTETTVLPTGGRSSITAGPHRWPATGQTRTPALRPSLPRMAFSPDLNANRDARSAAGSITVSPVPLRNTPGALPTTYVAQRNETLQAIARRFELPVGVLAANNNLKATARVAKGTRVKLPQTLMLSFEGKPVTGDVAPMLIDSTGVAAFRFLFEKQGGVVTWDPIHQQVKAHNDSHEVTLTVGSKKAMVNQKAVMMDLAAFLLSGRTMVPIRLFEKALHAQVDWEPSTGRIYVAMSN